MDKFKKLITSQKVNHLVIFKFRCYLPLYDGGHCKFEIEKEYHPSFITNEIPNSFLAAIANGIQDTLLFNPSKKVEIKNPDYELSRIEVLEFLRSFWEFKVNAVYTEHTNHIPNKAFISTKSV
jgi:hypothetical protein